mgnify:CR=1 FL=1
MTGVNVIGGVGKAVAPAPAPAYVCLCGRSSVQGYTLMVKCVQPGKGEHYRCMDCLWVQMRQIEDLRIKAIKNGL